MGYSDSKPEGPPPSLVLSNCHKSDSTAIKANVRMDYGEAFQIAVNQKKMAEARRVKLVEKLDKVASNDLTVT